MLCPNTGYIKELSDFKASMGWVSRFQHRRGLSSLVQYGEAGTTNMGKWWEKSLTSGRSPDGLAFAVLFLLSCAQLLLRQAAHPFSKSYQDIKLGTYADETALIESSLR